MPAVIVHHRGIDGTRPRGHTSLTGSVVSQLAAAFDGFATTGCHAGIYRHDDQGSSAQGD